MRKILVAMLLMLPGLATATATGSNIVVLGDSLAAAYGMDQQDGWVALLSARLQAKGYPHRVVNASISGETTAGGLRRLPKVLQRHDPSLVVVELGANDGLRASSLAAMRENLRQIIRRSRAAGAQVLLLGMRIPSNYGADYSDQFRAIYAEVAAEQSVPLLKFFLAPIASDRTYFQPDGLHPNERAQPLLLDPVWDELQPMLGGRKTTEEMQELIDQPTEQQ